MALRVPTPTISPACSGGNHSIVYISKYASYTRTLHKLASIIKVGTIKPVRYKILSLVNKLKYLSWSTSLIQCRNQFPHKIVRCDNNIVFKLSSCPSIKNQIHDILETTANTMLKYSIFNLWGHFVTSKSILLNYNKFYLQQQNQMWHFHCILSDP